VGKRKGWRDGGRGGEFKGKDRRSKVVSIAIIIYMYMHLSVKVRTVMS
jgi:hypothetical protein